MLLIQNFIRGFPVFRLTSFFDLLKLNLLKNNEPVFPKLLYAVMPILLFPLHVILLPKYVKHRFAYDFSFSIIIHKFIITYLSYQTSPKYTRVIFRK